MGRLSLTLLGGFSGLSQADVRARAHFQNSYHLPLVSVYPPVRRR